MSLNIITTTFNSQKTILTFLNKIKKIIIKNINDVEIIIVDDGSTDNTVNLIKNYKKKYNKLKIRLIIFNKNFGHHQAILQGIKFCKKQYAVIIDSDLEEDPSNILKLYKKINHSNLDLVYGVYKKNNSVLSSLFNKFLIKILDFNFDANIMTLRIMKKKYYSFLQKFSFKNFVLNSTIEEIGGNIQSIQIEKSKSPRRSSYNFLKKINLTFNLFTKIGDKFFGILFIILTIMSIIFVSYFIYVFQNWIFNSVTKPGFTATITLIIFFGIFNLILAAFNLIISIRISKSTNNNPDILLKQIIK